MSKTETYENLQLGAGLSQTEKYVGFKLLESQLASFDFQIPSTQTNLNKQRKTDMLELKKNALKLQLNMDSTKAGSIVVVIVWQLD